MNQKIIEKLIKMKKLDEQVRSELIRSNELFDGYHIEMEKIHVSNADELKKIIDEHGWPTQDRVGQEAAHAAWLIVHHAISKPEFQKKCLEILKSEHLSKRINPSWIAFLQDRIRVFEGKAQTYGTQFDWDKNGELSPRPIENPHILDKLRRSLGLEPIDQVIHEMRAKAEQEGNKPPTSHIEREKKFVEWTYKVGWRKN